MTMGKIYFVLLGVALLAMTIYLISTVSAATTATTSLTAVCPLIASWPTLQLGSTNEAVVQLQKVLNFSPDTLVAVMGAGSVGNETNYFGALTHQAVITFQEKYRTEILTPAGMVNGNGFVGLFTRTKAQQVCIAATNLLSVGTTPSSTVKGAASLLTSNGSGVCATTRNTCTVGTYRDVRDSTTLYKWSCQPTVKQGVAASCSRAKNVVAAAPQPSVAPTPVPAQSGSSGLTWGVYSGYSATDLASFESMVGKPVDMKAVFTNWNDSFPSDAATGLKAADKTLVIYWEQYDVTLDSIIAGDSDAYIKKFAAEAKAYGGKVLLAPFHEMNGNWDPWGGTVGNNSPAKVVAAWRHIYDVFGFQSNVSFVWAVNNISVPNTSGNAIAKYYPGDAYVDYVAVDGFNFGSPWQSFDDLFGKTLTEVSQYKKPIYILSVGSAEGTNKAAWITDAFTVQAPKYPLLKGWIWFNEDKEKDWRVNSDPSSLAAFKAALP